MPGIQELLIIAVIVFMLFGAKKIPELMRGMGQGITEFKRGVAFEPDSEPKEIPSSAPSDGIEKASESPAPP